MAASKRRSLSERLRSLFQRRSRTRSRLKRSKQALDFDEAPQRHMVESQRQLVRSISTKSKHAHHRHSHAHSTRCSACGSSSKTNKISVTASVKRPCGRVHGFHLQAAGPSSKSGRPTVEAVSAWSGLAYVSPLELFYHTHVVQFDNRLPKSSPEDGVPAQSGGGEKYRGARGVTQLSGQKSSKDNTIGSIDSIDSEEAIAVDEEEFSVGDAVISAGSEPVEVKQRQYVANTAKRLSEYAGGGLRVDGWNVTRDANSRDKRHDHLAPGTPCSLQRSPDIRERRDGLQEPTENTTKGQVVQNVPQRSETSRFGREHEFGGQSIGEKCEENVAEAKASPPITLAIGASTSSDVMTVSLSGKDNDSSRSSVLLSQQANGGLNMETRIDNAMINTKKSQDRISVTGKYSQVVVVHGNNQNFTSTSRDTLEASFSKTPDAEPAKDAAQPVAGTEDLALRLGRYNSFNICGESVYVTVGTTKTKIKTCRKRSSTKAQSGKAGRELTGGEKSHGHPVKKKKLKKKLKKKSQASNKGNICDDTLVSTCRGKGKKLTKIIASSRATYTKIGGNTVDSDSADLPSESEELNCVVAAHEIGNIKIESSDHGCHLTSNGNVRIEDGQNIEQAVTKDCAERDRFLLDAADNDWVCVTLNSSDQRPEPEGQDAGESGAVMAGTKTISAVVKAKVKEKQDSVCCDKDTANSIITENLGETTANAPLGTMNILAPGDGGDVSIGRSQPNFKDMETSENGGPSHNRTEFKSSLNKVYSNKVNIPHNMLISEHEDCVDEEEEEEDGGGGSKLAISVSNSITSETMQPEEIRKNFSHSLGGDSQPSTAGGSCLSVVTAVGVAADGIDDVDYDEDCAEEIGIVDGAGFVDVFALKRTWQGENRMLKKQITKYRDRSRYVIRLQQLIGQLGRETGEMRRMLEGLDGQTSALKQEAANMRCTLSAVCDVSDLVKSTEARSLEPACYRRYTNIRTPLDAANLLSAIRNRIKALGELEILVYRKQLVLHHVIPSSTQDRTPGPKRVLRTLHKGPKPKKNEESSTSKKGSIVIEVVSPSPESGVATPSWSEEVTNTESPMTISAALSASVEAGTPPICHLDASDV